MSNRTDAHLSEAQLTASFVDERDMPAPVREHLRACHDCLARKEQLAGRFLHLSRKAQQFAPRPKRKISLPGEPGQTARLPWVGRRHLKMAGAAAAAVCVIVLGSSLFRTDETTRLAKLAKELEADSKFMGEIAHLVENPLPSIYLDLTDEQDQAVDEDFIEFMAPDAQPNSISESKRKKDPLC